MSPWVGAPLAAKTALKRLARGVPMFPPRVSKFQPTRIAARRAAVKWLFTEKYVRYGPPGKGPELTPLGTAALAKVPHPHEYTAAELAVIVRLHKTVGTAALGQRLGRTRRAVAEKARELGLYTNHV